METYTYRISDIRIDTALTGSDLSCATLKGSLNVSPKAPGDGDLKATLREKGSGKVVKESTSGVNDGLDWTLDKGQVEAWWPVGYGTQPLYDLEITLLDKVGHTGLLPRFRADTCVRLGNK